MFDLSNEEIENRVNYLGKILQTSKDELIINIDINRNKLDQIKNFINTKLKDQIIYYDYSYVDHHYNNKDQTEYPINILIRDIVIIKDLIQDYIYTDLQIDNKNFTVKNNLYEYNFYLNNVHFLRTTIIYNYIFNNLLNDHILQMIYIKKLLYEDLSLKLTSDNKRRVQQFKALLYLYSCNKNITKLNNILIEKEIINSNNSVNIDFLNIINIFNSLNGIYIGKLGTEIYYSRYINKKNYKYLNIPLDIVILNYKYTCDLIRDNCNLIDSIKKSIYKLVNEKFKINEISIKVLGMINNFFKSCIIIKKGKIRLGTIYILDDNYPMISYENYKLDNINTTIKLGSLNLLLYYYYNHYFIKLLNLKQIYNGNNMLEKLNYINLKLFKDEMSISIEELKNIINILTHVTLLDLVPNTESINIELGNQEYIKGPEKIVFIDNLNLIEDTKNKLLLGDLVKFKGDKTNNIGRIIDILDSGIRPEWYIESENVNFYNSYQIQFKDKCRVVAFEKLEKINIENYNHKSIYLNKLLKCGAINIFPYSHGFKLDQKIIWSKYYRNLYYNSLKSLTTEHKFLTSPEKEGKIIQYYSNKIISSKYNLFKVKFLGNSINYLPFYELENKKQKTACKKSRSKMNLISKKYSIKSQKKLKSFKKKNRKKIQEIIKSQKKPRNYNNLCHYINIQINNLSEYLQKK
jgi:hypothetical protein